MNISNQRRVGTGLDVHPLVKGKFLIVGGVKIPSQLTSEGHSDGDALIHAVVDALLGAAGLGDIGTYFSSNEAKWKNASGKLFLSHTALMIQREGWNIENIDSTVILQNPKLLNYVPKIRENLSQILSIPKNVISVKATTTDYLGFIGEEKGWAVQALALLKRTNNLV